MKQYAASNKVEDALKDLARKYVTIRFIRLHYLEAEMDEIAAPGVLAYKTGDCFANLVSFINEVPAGKEISTAIVEEVLQRCVVSTRQRVRQVAYMWHRNKILV